MADTFSIKGVQIFSKGKWNGDEYSVKDLQAMVDAFNSTYPNVRPFLKLGHDESQKFLQKEGLPAAGWINKIYVKGEKLYADFVDIPRKIYDLIKRKAYRKVSSEIFWNIKVNDKKYSRMLAAVALLGGELPAVMNLDDILSLYGLKFDDIKSYTNNETEIREYLFEGEGNQMEEIKEEIKEETPVIEEPKEEIIEEKELTPIQEVAEALEEKAEFKALQAELDQKNIEIEELKKFKQEMDNKLIEEQKKTEKAEYEKFLNELENSKLMSPAMKPYVIEFLGEEKKEYSVKENVFSRRDLFKEILKLHAVSDVNLTENSEVTSEDNSDSIDSQIKEIETYAKEKNVSFSQAFREIGKVQELPKLTEDMEE